MSSSRVQTTWTGAPRSREISTASRTKSVSERRPKPPPMRVEWTRTDSTGTPAASAAASWVPPAACVGAHTSTPSGRTSAVQFMGSMVAWARKGVR